MGMGFVPRMMSSAFDAAPAATGPPATPGERGGLAGSAHRRAVSGRGAAPTRAGPGGPGRLPRGGLSCAVEPATPVGRHHTLNNGRAPRTIGEPAGGRAYVDVLSDGAGLSVTILGLEPDDFAVVAATPLLLALVLDAVASFGRPLAAWRGRVSRQAWPTAGRLAASPACAGTDASARRVVAATSALLGLVGGPMTPSSPPANLWGHLAATAARSELAVGLLSLAVLLLGVPSPGMPGTACRCTTFPPGDQGCRSRG